MSQKIKNIYHLVQAILSNIWYGFPSRHIKVIGVTGTDGKTTTTHALHHILSSLGKKTSMLSSIYGKVGKIVYNTGFHVTTPDSFMVQKMIWNAVQAGEEYFVLETTSHALDQNRVWGVQYEAAVLTNITHEHLDYHKTINEYATTKWRLIEMARVALVNVDDEETSKIVQSRKSPLRPDFAKAATGKQGFEGQAKIEKLKTYGLVNKADYSLDLRKEIQDLADFNAYNYLGALGLCRELGLAEKDIVKVLKTFKLPMGRIDIVHTGKFMVIVDFAHTPNAIKRILQTVRKLYLKNNGKLIHVFGSAALRDIAKRPMMGEISAQYADISIITEEDYRTENPHEISEQIAQGFKKYAKDYTILVDRNEAIHKALDLAQKDDVVIVTGKGHEKSLCRGKIEYPWSDTDCIQSYVHLLS